MPSRYAAELTQLHADVATLIADAKGRDGADRSEALQRAQDMLAEEPDVFEMCEMEATTVETQDQLTEYRQTADNLRKQLADEIAGANRSELFDGGTMLEPKKNSQFAELDAIKQKSKNSTNELRKALQQLDETEQVSADTLKELHRQRQTLENIDSQAVSYTHLTLPTKRIV
eukprot:TRINITY_DN14906_c0_g1_i7.p1 TRINITY_DN14906_c0_g1~~TRINITY_DN14906_c0_g1_i7.p1  ORF type:complete len:173 (+),score=39.03 TRINITY_DN14906_c0_g1_i7:242-760(+)